MLLKYKIRKGYLHNWLCKEAYIYNIGKLYEQKVHQSSLAFHAAAFDFEMRYDGKNLEKEFTEIVSGTTSPATEPILTGIRSWMYHISNHKFTLTVQDNTKELEKKIKKINENKPWSILKEV